jgi:hypothetical protein
VAYVRTVRTASGARAVQIVHSQRRGSREIEHIGSAHTDADLELLKAVARQRLAAGQGELELRMPGSPANDGAALPITSSRMGHLLDALARGYDVLGFGAATGRDEVFRALVLARVIEATSKLDSLRVLEEAGMDPPSYRTVQRRLRLYAGADSDTAEAAEAAPVDAAGGRWRARLARPCADHVRLGPATLLLYDVTTLYFETDTGDGFREPGFSKERRLEPQITVGLLTDPGGFPLMVHAFEGNKAETTTMLPVLTAFLQEHDLTGVTVVADAGMVSEANKQAIEAAGLSFILGARLPEVPYVVADWRTAHPGEQIEDGQVFVQPWPAGPADKRRAHTFIYSYRADRARRTLHGIDQQVAKAENAVAGKTPVKRNRYVRLAGATKSVDRALEAKNRALAGIQGLRHQPAQPRPERRDRRLRPAAERRAQLPDEQNRPRRPADLPPHPRVDRSPPDHRLRSPRPQPLDREHHRLVDPEVRHHHPPLPHHHHPGRRPHHHRRRPHPRRPTNRPGCDPRHALNGLSQDRRADADRHDRHT